MVGENGEADHVVVEAELMFWLPDLQADELEALCAEIGLECALVIKGTK